MTERYYNERTMTQIGNEWLNHAKEFPQDFLDEGNINFGMQKEGVPPFERKHIFKVAEKLRGEE